MRSPRASLLLPALLFACCTPSPPRPYSGGVLTHIAYVQIVGMPVELAEVAQDGMARGWRTVCTGKAGEESTIRLELPAGTLQADVDAYFSDLNHMRGSASHMIYHGMPRTNGCDEEPQRVRTVPLGADYHGPRTDPAVIMTGPEAELRSLLPVARSCGIPNPIVRPFRDGDITPPPDFVTPDFHSLVSSENISEHPGPALCFLDRSIRSRNGTRPAGPS